MSDTEPTHERFPLWDIFVTEDEPEAGLYELQWEVNGYFVRLIARNLAFAKKVWDLIAETRNNPDFRNIPLVNGRYRSRMTELELDEYFVNTAVCIGKDEKEDSRYYMRIASGNVFMRLDFRDEEIDAFLDTVREIMDEWWSDPKKV